MFELLGGKHRVELPRPACRTNAIHHPADIDTVAGEEGGLAAKTYHGVFLLVMEDFGVRQPGAIVDDVKQAGVADAGVAPGLVLS